MQTICLPDQSCNSVLHHDFKQPKGKTLSVRLPSGTERTFRGRPAWTLEKLVNAGSRGISSGELPAGLRLSHYVLLLRRKGVPIRTDREGHGGDYAGTHGRYRLSQPVQIVEAA